MLYTYYIVSGVFITILMDCVTVSPGLVQVLQGADSKTGFWGDTPVKGRGGAREAGVLSDRQTGVTPK